MGIEGEKISHENPGVPSGVPGDEDRQFPALNTLLHANLKAMYGTDDPARLEESLARNPGQREEFIKRFGAPSEVIPVPAAGTWEHLKQSRDEKDRISRLRQHALLQNEWNRLVDERAALSAEKALMENELMDIGTPSRLLHPFKARERDNLMQGLYEKTSQIAGKQHALQELTASIKALGFSSISPDQKYGKGEDEVPK